MKNASLVAVVVTLIGAIPARAADVPPTRLILDLQANTRITLPAIPVDSDATRAAVSAGSSRTISSLSFLHGSYSSEAFFLYGQGKDNPLCNLNFKHRISVTRTLPAQNLSLRSITTTGPRVFFTKADGKKLSDSGAWITINVRGSALIRSIDCQVDGTDASGFTVGDLVQTMAAGTRVVSE